VRCFMRHGNSSRRAGILAAREDYRHPTRQHGLQPYERKMKRRRCRWRTSAPSVVATSASGESDPAPGLLPNGVPGRDPHERCG
jgi:hypothetical protein